MAADLTIRQAVASALADMAVAWPKSKIDPVGLIDVYLRGLRGVPIASVQPAVDALLQRQGVRFVPPPGDLRAECLRIAELRGFGNARVDVAPPRGRFAAFPEDDCPVCGRAAEIVAEWTAESTKWDPARETWRADAVQYVVTYPPECPCWTHDRPRRAILRDPVWLTSGQQWAAQQHLETRQPPAIDPVVRAEMLALRDRAQVVRRAVAPDPWLTDERRGVRVDDAGSEPPTLPPLDESDAVAR